jgi:ketosteroid isomerase-like protein
MSDAHEQIRNLLGRYCERMDAGNFAGLAELFAAATLADENGNVFATGADEMRTMWERQTILYDGSPRTRHITANPVIDVDGDSAQCTSSYVVFQGTDGQPLQPIVTGRYATLSLVTTPASGGSRSAAMRSTTSGTCPTTCAAS